MVLYEVNYFDCVEWRWLSYEIIAENRQQVVDHVDNKRSPCARTEPHSDGKDSLEIILIKSVEMPFELPQN